jgi:hypothetical protein
MKVDDLIPSSPYCYWNSLVALVPYLTIRGSYVLCFVHALLTGLWKEKLIVMFESV